MNLRTAAIIAIVAVTAHLILTMVSYALSILYYVYYYEVSIIYLSIYGFGLLAAFFWISA